MAGYSVNMNRGTFLTSTKPAIAWIGKDDFVYLQEQRYQCANGDLVRIPLIVKEGRVYGFRLDFGSIPSIAVPIVGDRVNECAPAFATHDWLYVAKYVERDGQRVMIDRRRADDILLEALRTLDVDDTKAMLIYNAVRAGGSMFWCDDGPDAYMEHFIRLHVHVVPSFNPEADALLLHKLGIKEMTPCLNP